MKTLQLKLIAFIGIALISFGAQAQLDRSKMPVPGPEPVINLEKPNEFKLKNGITVMVVENNKLPRVSYQLSIDNKPYLEGEKAGVLSILSSMLGNGTTSISKDEFNEEVDFLGANISFGSSGGFGSGLVKYSDRIVELMADAAINPLLTEEEFQKEKDKLIEGLKTNEKSLDAVAGRVGSALSYGKDHVYGEFITEETVNKVTYQDVLDLYKLRFAPNNAYIVVVGDIDAKTAKKQLKKYFGKWKPSDIPNIEAPKLTANVSSSEINFVDLPNATQSSITVTNNVNLKQSDEDYFAVLMANNILGGGGEGYLFKNLREDKGYTYGAYSRLSPDRYGVARFSASAKVRNTVADSAVVEFLKEIKRIRTEPVEAQTLKNAKAKYVGNFVMALERPQTIANYALNIKRNNLPEDFYANYLENINNVTIEDIKRVSNKYFSADNSRIVVVGKGSDVLENLKKVGLPIKYYDKYASATEEPTYDIPMPADMNANKVLNAYIDAIGGRATLDKVNSVYITAEAELQPGVMMNLEMKRTSKNQSMSEVTAMGQSFMKSVVDGDGGYVVVQGQRKDLSGDELAEAKSESSPFPEVNYLNGGVTLEKIENVDGENAYKINVGDKKSIYYSVESGLKIKEVETSEIGSQSRFYSDYQEVAGIKFPFKMGQTAGPRRFDFLVKEVKVNEGVSDVDFD